MSVKILLSPDSVRNFSKSGQPIGVGSPTKLFRPGGQTLNFLSPNENVLPPPMILVPNIRLFGRYGVKNRRIATPY
jgi:hypothetical protein